MSVVLKITEQYRVGAEPRRCFDIFTRLRPEEFLHSDALIAAVESSHVPGGGQFNHVGAMQNIRFTDGAVIEETLTELVDGRKVAYRGRGFTQPIVGWADHADASFEFLEDRGDTLVVWSYAFTLREGPLMGVCRHFPERFSGHCLHAFHAQDATQSGQDHHAARDG